eukprot:NODE_575_length_5853_cov_0.947341.p1 type:complete len:642 gc:universal NODE_575_length_5853_cov_0.947341:5673-3748(-)
MQNCTKLMFWSFEDIKMQVVFKCSENVKITLNQETHTLNDTLTLQIEKIWGELITVTKDDMLIEICASPYYICEKFTMSIDVLNHFTFRIDNIKSSINIQSLEIFQRHVFISDGKECPAIGKQKNEFSDEIVSKEITLEDANLLFEKLNHREYNTSYISVPTLFIKDVFAFNRVTQIKVNENCFEFQWGCKYNEKFSKEIYFSKGNTRLYLHLYSTENIFNANHMAPSIGEIDNSFLYLPKYEYGQVVKSLLENLVSESHKIHTLMFGKSERIVENGDFSKFKDKLETLGIINKYKKMLKFILSKQSEQSNIENAYLDLCNVIRSLSSEFAFKLSCSPTSQVPYTESNINSIFFAKFFKDQWSIDYYGDRLLAYDDSVNTRQIYGRLCMFQKNYETAYEIMLNLPSEICQLELIVCEYFLGLLDSSSHRCNMLENIATLAFQYVILKNDNVLDQIALIQTSLEKQEIEAAIAYFDDIGLFEVSDELLRASLIRFSLFEPLQRHLLVACRFKDINLLNNLEHPEFKILAALMENQDPLEQDMQALQLLYENSPTPFVSQVLLLIYHKKNLILFKDWSKVLQTAKCPIIYELLWKNDQLDPTIKKLVQQIWSALSPDRKEPVLVSPNADIFQVERGQGLIARE